MLTALIYGVQFEIGLSDTVANGTFGPATQSGLVAQGVVYEGDSGRTWSSPRRSLLRLSLQSRSSRSSASCLSTGQASAGVPGFPADRYHARVLHGSSGSVRREGRRAAAQDFGFLAHTTIYFAVDYDAHDAEITSNVLPYFRGVLAGLRSGTSRAYSAGVYGTRNTCSRVSETFGLLHSFVSDMSTGYSGNLGFPMPVNLATALRADTSLSVLTAMVTAYQSGGSGPTRTRNRFADFCASRFSTPTGLAARGLQLFRFAGDVQLSTIRAGLMLPHLLGIIGDETIASLVAGFGDVLNRFR